MNHDGVVIVLGTTVALVLIAAVVYLLWTQPKAGSTATGSTGTTTDTSGSNASAYERLFGNTLSGVGTGLSAGGF